MTSFYIETYGCQMNVSDSESIAGILTSAGFHEVASPEEADLLIVNTCAVRESAVSRVKAQISRFKPLRARRKSRIALAGCLAQHEGEKLLKALPVDYVIGPDHYRFLAELTADKAVHADAAAGPDFYSDFPPVRRKGVNAWVPIMRGCDNFCSYCIVPYVRGREKSKPSETVLSEIERAAAEGFQEVTLLGQNVNSYRHGGTDFPALLEKIDAVKGLQRLRFMTSHPKDLSPALIRCFGGLPTLCEHLHLPVQSGSDRILAAMNRGYTADDYLRLIDALRARVPGIALTTDILCGFPGETDEDHARTLALIKKVEYDAAFMFIYSERSGTKAAALPGQVERDVKVARLNEIIREQMAITRKKTAAYEGCEVDVLVEGVSPRDAGAVTARTRTFKNVIFPGNPGDIGKTVRVRVTGSTGWALTGRVL